VFQNGFALLRERLPGFGHLEQLVAKMWKRGAGGEPPALGRVLPVIVDFQHVTHTMSRSAGTSLIGDVTGPRIRKDVCV
jgi:hypothetical protein